MEKTRKRFDCIDCGGPSDPYMLRHDLWRSLKLNYSDNLCLSCLTARLGRRIHDSDLLNVPVNRALRYVIDPTVA